MQASRKALKCDPLLDDGDREHGNSLLCFSHLDSRESQIHRCYWCQASLEFLWTSMGTFELSEREEEDNDNDVQIKKLTPLTNLSLGVILCF